MSQLVTTSEVDVVIGGLRRQQVLDIVRGVTFVGTLLLAWISLHPFPDLGDMQIGDATTGNELTTYAAFGGLAVLTILLAMRDGMPGLASLPHAGVRFFLPLGRRDDRALARSPHFDPPFRADRLCGGDGRGPDAVAEIAERVDALVQYRRAGAVGGLLSRNCVCAEFFDSSCDRPAGAPARRQLARIVRTQERGGCHHGDAAVPRYLHHPLRGLDIGAVIIGFSALFLLYSAGKSSLTLFFAVLLLTSLTSVVRSFWLRVLMLLIPLFLLNLLSVGTVIFDGLAEIAKLLPLDATFTGRTDIWTFAVQSLQERLLTGYGFSSFWGSSAVQNLPEGKEWAAFAAHSHNGYLDTALGMGLPGLALLLVALVIEPLRNFHNADLGGNNGPLAMVLLRIWLFGLYLSSMEVSSSTVPIRCGSPSCWRCSACIIWRVFASASEALRAAPLSPAPCPATIHRNRTAPEPTAISAPRRSGRRRRLCPIPASPARRRRDRSIP